MALQETPDGDEDRLWFEREEWEEDDIWIPRVTKVISLNHEEQEDGTVYPQDLWFILSDYIHPESIPKFSILSSGSHQVVHTATFWRKLYRRFYSYERAALMKLPKNLDLGCLDKRRGLQPRVARALQYLYRPFQDKLKNYAPFQFDLQQLENKGFKCALMWHKKKGDKKWAYYFKLRRDNYESSCMMCRGNRQETDPLYYNREAGCYILQVICHYFTLLQPVMGMTLFHTVMSVSPLSYRYYKLKLVFRMAGSNVDLLIDPSTSVSVFPWWHPLYPLDI